MARSKAERIAVMFDDYIFKLLKKGGEYVFDDDGRPIVTKDGPMRHIPDSLLNLIERRMHHGGLSQHGSKKEDKGFGGAVKELQQGGKLKYTGSGRIPMPKKDVG